MNITEARDAILTLFRVAWLADATSQNVPLYYWDVTADAPTDDEWARVTVRHLTGGNAAIGNKLFERTGVVTVQIFTQFGTGNVLSDELAQIAVNAFDGQSTGAVWFRNVRVTEIGQDGQWFNVNVYAEFEYTERK